VVKYKLGRTPSAPHDLGRRLRLKHFLKAGYTGAVPDTVSYLPAVSNLPLDGNGKLGDCTAAAAAHIETALSQFGQGSPVVLPESDVVKFYSGSTGYVPGKPATDQGGDMLTVQKYWQSTGIAGHKIAAYFAVDPTDFEEMRAALFLFGNLYIGFNCPQSALDVFGKPGAVWDVDTGKGSRIVGGHAVAVHKMVKGGNLTVSSWGGTIEMTPAFWTAFVDEPYAVCSQTWIKNGLSPEGLDVAGINAAFQQVTGNPGPFTGTPTPAPVDPDKPLAAAARAWLTAKKL
jgi:hypothetical protein